MSTHTQRPPTPEAGTARHLPMTHRTGLWLALAAATISGFAVFLNGFAVRAAPGPLAFTTGKNAVAAAVILTVLLLSPARAAAVPTLRSLDRRQRLVLGYVGAISGGLAFGLFFTGLSMASSTQAAFAQKSLVLWVMVLAVPMLHERVGVPVLLAVAALVTGQVLLLAGRGPGSAGVAAGLAMVLVATVLWSVEIVLVRGWLTSVPAPLLGSVRLGVGTLVLLTWLVASGGAGQLAALPWSWVLLTGLILPAYVLTWFGALRRAPALEVTAVLVWGAFVTGLLAVPGSAAIDLNQVTGLALIAAGVIALVWTQQRAPDPLRGPGPA
jgi:drug/metabolite transporter (DMT)-like permease